MDKFNGLLKRVSDEYKILRGETESVLDWKARIIYSLCGQMGYASLWDKDEKDPGISVTHIKNRIRSIFRSYKEMYPEVKGMAGLDETVLADEIYGVFLKAGIVYHRSNRIAPAMYSESYRSGVKLVRGISLEQEYRVSGLGAFETRDGAVSDGRISDMFQLEDMPIGNLWKETVDRAEWREGPFAQPAEFLKMTGPFSSGYWTGQPYRNGEVSIMRSGGKGNWLYFLYKIEEGTVWTSPLQDWQVKDHNHRLLANACLSANKQLPPVRYRRNGMTVDIYPGYLLPPAELNLIKLYSWPKSYEAFPCDFRRVCDKYVFGSVMETLSEKGYGFREV